MGGTLQKGYAAREGKILRVLTEGVGGKESEESEERERL